jgi:hypothetical protein
MDEMVKAIYRHSLEGTEENNGKHHSGQSVSPPGFEADSSRMQIRNSTVRANSLILTARNK